MSKSSILSLQHVGAFYWRQAGYLRKEQFWALKDISFELYHGDSLGVIGRNSAAKAPCFESSPAFCTPTEVC
ncbi:MAG: hypothetical protein R3F40_07630 [Candidatus Competibacteraceae bacterium]